MTGSQAEFERYLDDWLGNTPIDPADRVVVAVSVRIRRQRQRPLYALPGAWTPARPFLAAAAAIAFAVTLGVALAALGWRPGGVASPFAASPTPSTTPSPTPEPSPTPAPVAIEVTLTGGLPDGWSVTAGGLLSFRTGSAAEAVTVELLEDRLVMDEACAFGSEAGTGGTAAEIVGALAKRRGLIATDERATTVGGLTGRRVDLRPDPVVGPTCPDDELAYVPLLGTQAADGWHFVGLAPGETARLMVLDIPDGRNVVILIIGTGGAFERHIADAMTIVANLSFDTGP